MSTEPYVPDESALIATYWDAKARQVDNPQTSEIVAEARRGIAKIKADALKEAAQAARGMHDPVATDCAEWGDWMDARADWIEKEA